MPISYNPQSGEAFALDPNGAWAPTKVARNPQTGEAFALDGAEWKALPIGQAELGPRAPKPRPERGALETVNRIVGGTADAATQGASFGFADELGAAVRATARAGTNLLTGKDADWGGGYDRALDDIRGREKDFAEEYPVPSTAANIVGGLATGGGATLGSRAGAQAGFKAAANEMQALGRAGQSIPGGMARTVATSAGHGALGGFGAGEGGLENRLGSALVGGAVGAGLGAALPAVGYGVNKGFGIARNAFGLGDPRAKALDHLGRALRRDEPMNAEATPSGVARTLGATGKPMTVADAAGNNTLRLGRTVETIPGAGSDRATKFLHERQAGQGERVGEDIAGGLGGDDFYKTLDDLDMRRRADAAPLYEEAYAQPFVWNPALEALLNRPSTRSALARARRIAEEEGRDPSGLGLDLDADGNVTINRTAASMQTLDYVKRGLDDVVEATRNEVTGKLKLDEDSQAVNQTRRNFLSVVDRLNPKYAEARKAWGGPTQTMEAARLGRRFAKGDPEVVIQRFHDLSPGDQDVFRLGVARELAGVVENSRDGHDVVARIFGSRGQRERLRELFPDADSYTRFAKAMADESLMNRTRNKVTGNSATGRIAAEQDDAGQLENSFMDYAGGGLSGFVFGLLRRGANRARGLNEASADELSKMMFTTDRAEQRRVMAEILRRTRTTERRANRGVHMLQGGVAATSNLIGQGAAEGKEPR
jgi:hypothetical protein